LSPAPQAPRRCAGEFSTVKDDSSKPKAGPTAMPTSGFELASLAVVNCAEGALVLN